SHRLGAQAFKLLMDGALVYSGYDKLAARAAAPQCGHCPVRSFVWIMSTRTYPLPLNNFKDQLRSTTCAFRKAFPSLLIPACRKRKFVVFPEFRYGATRATALCTEAPGFAHFNSSVVRHHIHCEFSGDLELP